MKKFFTISTLSLTALITAQYSLAKKFIYDDQTGLYSEIRDNQNYNNSGQYYSPLFTVNRNNKTVAITMIPTVIKELTQRCQDHLGIGKKAIKFQSHSEQTILKLKVMILHVFTTWVHLNNGTKLIVTTF